MKYVVITVSLLIVLGLVGYYFYTPYSVGKKEPVYSSGSLEPPRISFSPPVYNFTPKNYNNPEYPLPLGELPENYERDIVTRFGVDLDDEQKNILLNNGVIIIPGERFERFENAYKSLSEKNIPIFITSDSILHLFHIEFNEILKNLEIKKLSPMLKSFLDSVIEESIRQYNGLNDKELKELARRNVAYLCVARKLLDPNYRVPYFVSKEVNEEIKRIEDHKGFYKSPLLSLDCPKECLNGFAFSLGKYPNGESCLQSIKGGKIFYQGKNWDSVEFYKEVCTRLCYCEDYSQYVPRGHYTQSEELKRYFKAMMWLGRITFKLRGENWTKQAILLTDAVKSAKVEWEGKEYSTYEIYNKIYTITGFFAGASDDLTFYDYDNAVKKTCGYEFNEEERLKENVKDKLYEEISKMRGPKILGGFEIDLAGNLKDLTQGLRLIGQRYALDSEILGDLVYKNVGPNPESPYYEEVIDYCLETSCSGLPSCTKPKEFYFDCEKMEENRTKYWNEVCGAAVELYCGCAGCSKDTPKEKLEKLYSVCRFVPSGLDVMNVIGSKKAENILKSYYHNGYCKYEDRQEELKSLVNSYSEKNWTKNLYNTWLWILQPILKEKPEGYPSWMRSEIWKLKDLITALSSWAELRHDTILYVKQSYTWAAAGTRVTAVSPLEARYYGYVEPNPELFAKAKFAVDFLKQGLEDQGVITNEVKNSLEESSKMMARLQKISEKELNGEALSEEDYNYIKSIDSTFNSILKSLTSTLKIKSGSCPPGMKCNVETSLGGKEDAFKTSLVADVHTDANSKRTLEVGTGKVNWILVAHKSKDGRIGLAAGPVFSYYEFVWPMGDRLTDEKWRSEILGTMKRPIWYKEVGLNTSESPYVVGK